MANRLKFLHLKPSERPLIDNYLKQAPINKPGSIVGDYEFKKANDTLNAVCKNLLKEGKVRPVVHKTPITSEQLQKLFESGQLRNADTKDPKQLQQTAWFYTYLYFGRRRRENQRSLTPKIFIFCQTPQGRRYFELRRDFPGAVLSTKNRPPRRRKRQQRRSRRQNVCQLFSRI